jgi:hypothetical protein
MERFPRNALTIQLPASAPFNRVALHGAFFVFGLDVHEGMRISEEELHEVPLDRFRLILEVGGCEGMVRLDAGASHQRDSHAEQYEQRAFHVSILLTDGCEFCAPGNLLLVPISGSSLQYDGAVYILRVSEFIVRFVLAMRAADADLPRRRGRSRTFPAQARGFPTGLTRALIRDPLIPVRGIASRL